MTGKKALFDEGTLNTLLTGEGPLPDDAYLTKHEHGAVVSSLRGALEETGRELKALRRAYTTVKKDLADEKTAKYKVEVDRDKYRDWIKFKFGWFVDIHAEGKTPNMPWLIKDMTKLFNNVQPFYWG